MTERKVPNFLIESNTGSNIKNIVGIVSGKGGVGKSLVTCLLANEMAKKDIKLVSWMEILQDHLYQNILD